jgi:hypothetical protein
MATEQNMPAQTNTIAKGATLHWTWNWQNIPNVGPNHGPVFFMADPDSHQAAEVRLVTLNLAKCRNAPSGPGPGNPGTEVFYAFDVRNESSIDARYRIEMVWGQVAPAGQTKNPW